MGINTRTNPVTKKRKFAAANASGCGSTSAATVEMPPHVVDHIQPPPPLPPGVYFSPTWDECLGFLNRWIAGDKEMADARGYIFGANVYGESPDALRQRHPPASIRGRGEHAWWFLSETRFQSQIVGGGASKRADRRVETSGFWRLEQGKERLKQGEEEEEADGVKNCFGFYVGPRKRDDKTPWLMQEFTSANDDGAGKLGVPALYKVYVTPRATGEQLQDIFGEHHVKKRLDGTKLPARTMVSQEYFDGIANLLPEGSVRGVVQDQEHIQAPPPPPLVAPTGLLEYYGQHDQHLGRYEQQQGKYLGQYEQQEGQYLFQYEYEHEHEQQQGQYLGHDEQQQGPFSVVAPPAPPGLLGEFTDNLSMPMADFMRIVDEQPVETFKGGEPNWESLPGILDADEFTRFTKEG